MPLPRPARRGFTLLELLVVLAILGVLIGLLLPAVQKVREAANRARCQNHLKQLALAVHGYHDSYRHFPRNGGCCNPNAVPGQWSWIAKLLPNLEQGTLYARGNLAAQPAVKAAQPGLGNVSAATKVIPVLLCPSDDAAAEGTRTDRSDLAGVPIGLTNYQGCSGANWKWGPFAHRTVADADGTFNGNGLDRGNGIFYRNDTANKLRIASITDGTSTTFLIGEAIPGMNQWCAWPYAGNANATCAIPPNHGLRPPTTVKPSDFTQAFSFRSRHTGGLHFAFADASVRFVGDSIDLSLYRALATIKGGEILDGDVP